jgi:hypothetical protein
VRQFKISSVIHDHIYTVPRIPTSSPRSRLGIVPDEDDDLNASLSPRDRR